MLYQGQQQDPESNLYYLRARYYDPATGRFISRDPVKGYLQDPRTQNGYDYALNNPINLSDPSGENPILNACARIAGQITGYTTHGLNQAIGRDAGKGVAPNAILDAVRNPQGIIKQADGALKYIGENATVVLNEAGKIITSWANSGEGIRGL